MMLRRQIVVFLAGAYPAFADAIDGQWCLGSGHLEIDEPRIRTLVGTEIIGTMQVKPCGRKCRRGGRAYSWRL
jgi:hypothetical protein